MRHQHIAHEIIMDAGFSHPAPAVHEDENPLAHGGVSDLERCACGAQRVTNRNHGHAEGPSRWVLTSDVHTVYVGEEDAGFLLWVARQQVAAAWAVEACGAQRRISTISTPIASLPERYVRAVAPHGLAKVDLGPELRPTIGPMQIG